MRHTASVFLILAFIWLFNSGHYTALLLSLGLLSVAFVAWIAHRMDIVDRESQPIHLTLKLPGYYWWLFRKILAANLDVAVRAWRGPSAISPCIGSIPVNQTTDMGRVIYANSITLTPGTVAMRLDGDTIIVHALTREGLSELHSGEMERRVRELEE
ncbi:Na+/H+ antiporter subunit E [Microbulbifer sp.]|uniref:Na+/H+ antiporter subunit E n=1 Tax=Microbulbifer sp. TaxID=1908541 RepID=UPI003F2D4BB7